jgi:hypothetical protein
MFHPFGGCHWPKESSLNRARDDGIPSGDQVVKHKAAHASAVGPMPHWLSEPDGKQAKVHL